MSIKGKKSLSHLIKDENSCFKNSNMFSLCRLCAACTDPIELITEISELESKLVHCFGWQRSEKELEMPKRACNSCVDRLHRSYDFVECMLTAEKQLNKLLSEQIQTVTDEFLPQTIEIKLEDIKNRVTIVPEEPIELESFEGFDNVNANNSNDDYKYDAMEYDDDDDNGGIFGEPIDYSDVDDDDADDKNDSSIQTLTKKVPKKRVRKRKRRSEPFLDALDIEDRLENGQISSNGVRKLEKLFPDMKTMSWADCQYKCEKCERTFTGSINFYAHIRSSHIKDVLSIVVPCFYCNSKHRREFQLNRHIATEHFAHLKFRYE